MNASLRTQRSPRSDATPLPPKQTEWRKYSKTLIEELKEKLEDRRAKTLALLAENKDLAAFHEIDTESDGLDDTSTNVTSKMDRQSAQQELDSEQMLALSSQSEASSLTDCDCCKDELHPALHRHCAFSENVTGCDGECTHYSYSLTSTVSTEEEDHSKSISLTPPPHHSKDTVTSPGRTLAAYGENDANSPALTLKKEASRADTSSGMCGGLRVHHHVSTAYIVRRSSSHYCLTASTSLVTHNVNVRMSRSYTHLDQDIDYELQYEKMYSSVSRIGCIRRLDSRETFDTSKQCEDIRFDDVERDTTLQTQLTDLVSVSFAGTPTGAFKETAQANAVNLLSQSFIISNRTPDRKEFPDKSKLTLDISFFNNEMKSWDKRAEIRDEYTDHVIEDRTNSVGMQTEIRLECLKTLTGKLNEIVCDKQCGDIKKPLKTEYFEPEKKVTDLASSDRKASENCYFQWKQMFEEICDVINKSLLEDIDKMLVLQLKQRINRCSAGLNVSSNSGYATSMKDVGESSHELEGSSMSDWSSQQLKMCLEKARLASTLQKKVSQAKSNIATTAARKAYEKAIGDFDGVMNDFLKSHLPEDGQRPRDDQNRIDPVASFRRSETFVIDKDSDIEHRPTWNISESPFLKRETVANNEESYKQNDGTADYIEEDVMKGNKSGPGSYNNDKPPKSSPTFLVSKEPPVVRKQTKRKKQSSKRHIANQFLSGIKGPDTDAYLLKHKSPAANIDSESDSTDSVSDTIDPHPPKYTSSILAQLLDYDSQDEKTFSKHEQSVSDERFKGYDKSELDTSPIKYEVPLSQTKSKENEQSELDRRAEQSILDKTFQTNKQTKIIVKTKNAFSSNNDRVVSDITFDSEENFACNHPMENINTFALATTEIDKDPCVDYDSDFNTGSISECIQEEDENVDNDDHDLGLCFKTSDKKDVDSSTFYLDRPGRSRDSSDMNDDAALAKDKTNLDLFDFEGFNLKDEQNTTLGTKVKTDNMNNEEIDHSTIDPKTLKSEKTNDGDVSASHNADCKPSYSSKKEDEEENIGTNRTKTRGVKSFHQTETPGTSAGVDNTATTSSSCNYRESKRRFGKHVLKLSDDKPSDCGRTQFIPMVEWSSSEEDVFEDLTRDKSPSDLLRQKQKEIVDEKLKKLTEISKRRRKSRSPVSYRLPDSCVNLKTLLQNALRDGDQEMNITDATYASLSFGQKQLFTVLKSPVETHRETVPAQPSVSDLLIARLNNDETDPDLKKASTEPKQDLAHEENTEIVEVSNEFQTPGENTIKLPSQLLKAITSPESPQRFVTISSFTSQSPTKARQLNDRGQHGAAKELSSKTASTDRASSVSSTSDEYNLPENVSQGRNDSIPLDELLNFETQVGEIQEENILPDQFENSDILKNTQRCNPKQKEIGSSPGLESTEILAQDQKCQWTLSSQETKAVDTRVREVKMEHQVVSHVPRQILTAVTEGGPHIVCDDNEDFQLSNKEVILNEVRVSLSKDPNIGKRKCCTDYGQQSSIAKSDSESKNADQKGTTMDKLDWHEDENRLLIPTPVNSPYNSDEDNEHAQYIEDDKEGKGEAVIDKLDDWMFVGDLETFRKFVDTKKTTDKSECEFGVRNNASELVNLSRLDCVKSDIKKESEQSTKESHKFVSTKIYMECCGQSSKNSHTDGPNDQKDTYTLEAKRLSPTELKILEINANAEIDCSSERQGHNQNILSSLLDKITLLENLVGQSQKPDNTTNDQLYPNSVSCLPSGHPHTRTGDATPSQLSVNAPFLCPFCIHEYPRSSFHNCWDYYGMCGRRSTGMVHLNEEMVDRFATDKVRSRASQTEASNVKREKIVRLHSVSTQCLPHDCESNRNMECLVPTKQTKQFGCQVDFSPSKCQCMQQCLSSIDNLEGIERKMHEELVSSVKSCKKETEDLVNVGYDRVSTLLTTQLTESLDRSQQILSSLMTTYNQTVIQQLADINRSIASMQSVKELTTDGKGQTTKTGIDYDTLKMRVVELTSQRDAEKVFHKITRESLRALERDHDRLRQEYVRATYRRHHHNIEGEARQRVYNLLSEPDSHHCRHRSDKGHHSKYLTRLASDETKRFYFADDQPEQPAGRDRSIHRACKDESRKHKSEGAGSRACSETSKSRAHRSDKKSAHLSKRHDKELNKDIMAAFDNSISFGNSRNFSCEVVNDSSLCCQVELKPSMSQSEENRERSRPESRSKTESSQHLTTGSREEHSTNTERSSTEQQNGIKDPGSRNAKLHASVVKDGDACAVQRSAVLPTNESSADISVTKTKMEPVVSDSKSSLALTNDSF
ncbi:hypothetical protein Bpfe_015967 [Biomphalaria pfeifferi]|uniref:Uncharacterized protein n=1 Tax=Biomphalaria pfeifferi TaxID=112525 RepID=A0AAD8BIA3_BIOPF|nr:hypothetical protein Bpfe_015967 [Biomphalaria pfeifferi]